MRLNWTLFRSSAALTFLGVGISAGLAVKQWADSPIAIRPFTVADGPNTAGVSPAALADQVKADISAIYSQSGDLFQRRKLGEPTIPLDVKIGDTGWNLQSLVRALGIPLNSADISGRVVHDGDKLVLQWTTVKPDGVTVEQFAIEGTDSSPLANINAALACLALRTVAGLSPDVAANYLQKQEESGGGTAQSNCLAQDDVSLYSKVSTADALPAAARVNALVGLSVHFSYLHQLFEELTMAEAATRLASRALSCDDTDVLPTRWQRLECRVIAYRPFTDKNVRANVAAWMQLGAARSDYAAAAPTLREMYDRRRLAIAAYEHVIAIKGDYALAYDAKGLQHSLLNETDEAVRAYGKSLAAGETSSAHIDFGLFLIHGRDDSFDTQVLRTNELSGAETHFRKAIELTPDYWDAYGRLGYVLREAGKLREAVDVLEAATEHDASNRSLRLLLGSVYAGQCRFGPAKANFQSAYDGDILTGDRDAALNVLADWGTALARFGLVNWAIAEETGVLAAEPTHVHALRARGWIEINSAGPDPAVIAAGIADLAAAADNDSAKSDAVLSAYLEALVQTGHAADAVATYEAWGREGYVPAPAAASTLDAAILPAAPKTRLAYATALLKNSQGDSAARERAVLVQLGVKPDLLEGADLPAREANEPIDAIPTAVNLRISDSAKDCDLASAAREPLLTDSASLIPAHDLHAGVLARD